MESTPSRIYVPQHVIIFIVTQRLLCKQNPKTFQSFYFPCRTLRKAHRLGKHPPKKLGLGIQLAASYMPFPS